MSDHKSMEKIFEQIIIEQDSILCKIHPEVLRIISEYLPPNDVLNISHTCKELHQKLPFYLKKSGTFTFATVLTEHPLFEGPGSNFSFSEISISFTAAPVSMFDHCFGQMGAIAVWIQIIDSGVVVLETQKYYTDLIERNNQIKIKNATLREYKGGDRLRFMGQWIWPFLVDTPQDFRFQVSLLLENYKYGKPIDITKKVKGYADFKYPSVSID